MTHKHLGSPIALHRIVIPFPYFWYSNQEESPIVSLYFLSIYLFNRSFILYHNECLMMLQALLQFEIEISDRRWHLNQIAIRIRKTLTAFQEVNRFLEDTFHSIAFYLIRILIFNLFLLIFVWERYFTMQNENKMKRTETMQCLWQDSSFASTYKCLLISFLAEDLFGSPYTKKKAPLSQFDADIYERIVFLMWLLVSKLVFNHFVSHEDEGNDTENKTFWTFSGRKKKCLILFFRFHLQRRRSGLFFLVDAVLLNA